MRRVTDALVVVLLVCAGIRVAAWLIEPVLPLLGGLAVVAAIGIVLLGRGGWGGGGYR